MQNRELTITNNDHARHKNGSVSGCTILINCVKLLLDNVISKLSELTDSELSDLAILLNRLSAIASKLILLNPLIGM